MNMTVKSSELQPGDVVLAYGMRCLVDSPINRRQDVGDDLPVYWTETRVLNPDEVKAHGVVPMSWLYGRGERRGELGVPRWLVQGNDRATWAVERADEP